ncbi:MAG: lysophospholipid acyltransferase family protein [Ktedonobacteraceae bacterium]
MGTGVKENATQHSSLVGDMIYSIIWVLAWVFMHIVCRYRVEGREHIKRIAPSQPILIVANHLSWYDPLLLGLVLQRRVWFFTKAEAFRWPIVGWLIHHTGQIAVHRGEGDRAALEYAVSYIRANKALVVFPEGTVERQEQMITAHPGVAVIALRANALIVPVALSGTRRILRSHGGWRPKVTMRIGVPYVPTLPVGLPRKVGMQVLTEEMMDKIADMLPVEQRGVYL